MYSPSDFDYDLWTTKDKGVTRYWVRVRATGEVTEVSHEVMKFLRYEERKLRQQQKAIMVHGPMLSLDAMVLEDEDGNWICDPYDGVQEQEVLMDTIAFRQMLTPYQEAILDECILGDLCVSKFAKLRGVSRQAVIFAIEGIQKKAKKFFEHTYYLAKKRAL